LCDTENSILAFTVAERELIAGPLNHVIGWRGIKMARDGWMARRQDSQRLRRL
jgi:hypothetical protein